LKHDNCKPKHTALRKRYTLLLSLLLFSLTVSSQDLYWVGGSGSWDDQAHWSTNSGGNGGSAVPSENDNVIIDENSILDGDLIVVNTDFTVENLTIDTKKNVTFSSLGENLLVIKNNWNIHNESQLNLELGNSILSIPTAPDFSNLSQLNGGFYFIGGELSVWSKKKWIKYDNPDKAGHIAVVTVTNPQCNGDQTGSALGSVIGGVGPFSYVWTGGTLGTNLVTGNPINNLGAGLYTLIVFDLDDGSFSTTNFSIDPPPVINGIFIETQPSCVGSSDGIINLSFIFGGTGSTYDVLWSTGLSENGVTSSSISGLVEGPYWVQITDSVGCVVTRYDTLVDPAPVFINAVVSDVSCNGLNDGAITTNATSGNPGSFTYLWSPDGETTASISNKLAGTYDLHIEDANGCAKDTSIIIDEPNVLTAIISSKTDLLCNGDCSVGEAIVTPSGGIAPYSYQWFDAANNPLGGYTDSIASNLCAGSYSVVITDVNLCTVSVNNIIINEPPALSAVASATPALCNGAPTGSVVVTPAGGTLPYSYNWATNPGNVVVGTDSLVNGLPTGTYDYEVLDANNCVVTGSVFIAEPDTIGFDFAKLDLACFGDMNGQAVISNVSGGDGNYSYAWRNAASTIIGTGTLITNLGAGSYSITVTDGNNCTESLNFDILEPSEITLVLSMDSVSCNGFTDGAVHVVASGGTVAVDYSYDWRNSSNVQVGTTADVNGLPAGSYTVTVTDDNNCTQTGSIDIEEPQAISVVPSITDVTCSGAFDGAIAVSISGGTPNYQTNWTGPNAFVASTQNISGLEGGNYTLTITDANGCIDVQNYVVDEPLPISFTPTISDVNCFGASTGSIVVVVSGGNGGYIYDWRDAGNVQISTTNTIINVPAGDYTLIVSDALGCMNSETYTINEISEITVNAVLTPITCFNAADGAIEITPAGGTPIYNYAWTGPNLFNSTNQNISGLEAGTYNLTITDQNSCTKDTIIVLANPPEITVVETITDITCFGDMNGAINIVINGGVPPFLTEWAGPNAFSSSNQNISNLDAGDYTLTITDQNNCVVVNTYTVDQPADFVFTPSITDVLCFGDSTGSISVAVTGGNGGYVYDWRDANNILISSTNAIVNVPAGDYTLTVTDNQNCSHNETYTINESSEIFFNATVNIISCFNANDGAINLAPMGGLPLYTFAWTGPNAFNSSDQNISSLEPGDYICTITDQNLCTKDTTITLLNPATIVITETITDVICNGDSTGAIDIVISGGTPTYLVAWTGPNGFTASTQNISNLVAGTYDVLVTDAGGCTSTGSYLVDETSAIVFTPSITDILCFGDSTGSISVVVSGGNGGYVYEWRDSANNLISITDEIVNVPAGAYTLTVMDAQSCIYSETYTIQQPLQGITLDLSAIDVACFNDSTGSVAVAISGGTVGTPADYTIEWYDQTNALIGSSQIVSGLPAGVYTVFVSDLNNCIQSDSIEIFQGSEIFLNPSFYNVLCFGDSTGGASVNPTGGTVAGDYTYEWENIIAPGVIISTTNSIIDVPSGGYSVTVTDDNNCSDTTTIYIGEPAAIELNFILDEPLCNGDMNGQIEVVASGGTVALDYVFEWQDQFGNVIGTNALISGLSSGSYLCIVTDDNGCTSQSTINLGEPALLNFTPQIQQISCAGIDDGEISVLITGGNEPYTISWTDQLGSFIGSSTIISNLAAGDYTISVSDANNCSYSETYTISPQNTITLSYTQYALGDCSPNPPCVAAAAISASGGTGIYTNYQWIDEFGNDLGINNDTATALCSGSYLVTVTDSDGCSGTILILINDQTPEDISVASTDPVCNGDLGLAIAEYVCNDAPCVLEWFDASTNTTLGLSTDTVNLPAGDYFVSITNATGCSTHLLFTLSEPSPIVPNSATTPASCNGICDGTASVSPSGGTGPYTFLWDDPASQTTATAIDLCAGDYNVTITDVNLCDTIITITVGSPSPIDVVPTISNINCNGDNDGSISLNVSGGSGIYTYNWTPEPPIGNGTATGSGLSAGDYSIEIEDVVNPGCLLTVTYTVSEVDSLQGTLSAVESNCSTDDGEASIVVSGGTPNYTYLWNDPAAQTTPTATGLFAGIYTVTVSDANNCSEVFSIEVNDIGADPIDVEIVGPLCAEDSSTVTAVYTCTSTPCEITWYDGFGNILPLSGDVVNLPAGNYYVGIINGIGCKRFIPFELIGVNPIEPNLIVTNETCDGPANGTASVNPNNGNGVFTYNWVPEPGSGQGSANVDGLYAGMWEVTITDELGCDTVVTFEVLPYSPIVATVNHTDLSCFGDDAATANVSASGGNAPLTYLWAPEPGSGQGTANAGGLYAGDWSVTIADTSGCDTTLMFTIIEPSELTADSLVNNASCNVVPGDGSLDLIVSGGAPPYTYQWFDAAGTDLGVSTSFMTDLVEGIYHCVVVDDSLCTETFVVIVSEQTGETINSGSVPVNCYGGDDGIAWVEYVCADAPCGVNWYDELGVDLGLTTDTIYNLSAGSYVVGVTNASGCVSYNNVVVSEADEIVIDISVVDASCSGICDGEANATVSGGTGNLSYLWAPEPPTGQGTPNVSGLCGGTWTLYVTDENGCMDSVQFDISEIEVIVSNLQITNESCEGDCNGAASVAPTGGSGDYTYFWSPEPANGQGTNSVSGLCAGDWTVEISDLNTGCNLSEVFTISQVNPIYLIDATIVDPECENDNSGSIEAIMEGGVLPYTYQWYNDDLSPISGETDSIITGLSPGTYILEVTDDEGCTHSETFMLNAQSTLTADAGADTSYCGGSENITLVGTGNGISSLWMDILGNVLSMGDSLTVQAEVGNFGYIFQTSDGICTASDTVYVVVFAQPFADAGPDQDILLEESVQIGGDPTGPGGSVFMWSPGATLSDSLIANPIAAPLITTEYIVYVEDANGCINSDTVTVTIVPEFSPNDGFTPNGDGINDVWIIGDLTDYPNIEVNIFNRWGQQLFSSTGYSDPWDGKHNGKDLPVGTYYYVIDLHDEDYPDAFTGPLTIMR